MKKKAPQKVIPNTKRLELFIDTVNTNNYNVIPEEFTNTLITLLSDSNTAKETEEYLDIYISRYPSFHNSSLATFILSIYEKYIGSITDKSKAINLALNIIKESKNKQSFALASLIRICKFIDDYSYIDSLFTEKSELKTIKTIEVLYELTFYYNAKKDLDKIASTLRVMINSFSDNRPVLNTAQALALRYGLYDELEELLKEKISIVEKNNPLKRTAQKIYDIEYESMLESYEKALSSAALADLTQGIAHEFGQPVTNIRYNIQYHTIIFKERNTDLISLEEVLSCFNDILSQTKRIGNLVEQLEPITSRATVISSINLKSLFEDILEQERIKLQEYDIKTVLRVKAETAIEFDRTQLSQIIVNLLLNSIDSIIEKKELEPTFQGMITISANIQPQSYLISIADNGKGISAEDRTRIFNPFYTTKAPNKGTGLGLYIISNLLKVYSGHIKLDSNHLQGAKFDISIPKHKLK